MVVPVTPERKRAIVTRAKARRLTMGIADRIPDALA